MIADGGGTANGVLSLGKNILVGFVSFDGFNFEDAIIVSEKLVKNDSFTSIHIDEFTAEVRETPSGQGRIHQRYTECQRKSACVILMSTVWFARERESARRYSGRQGCTEEQDGTDT